MERLVITYSVGDGYTYSSEVVECVEYESAEAFYCHLEEACTAYMAALYDHDREWTEWQPKFQELAHNVVRAHKPKAKEEAQRVLDEHNKLRPGVVDAVPHEVKLGTLTLDLTHFVVRAGDQFLSSRKDKPYEYVIHMPTIETLEEWWNSKLAD